MQQPQRMCEVFLNGNFFAFWLGQIVAQFGEKLTQMALVGLIYEQVSFSTQDMSLLMIFMILPVFLFNPIAGICVDLWDRKRTMIWSDLGRAVLLLLLPLVLYAFPPEGPWGLFPIYIMVFAIFSVARFFIPAKSAIIPEIMDFQDLRTANSISATSKMIAILLGVLGGGTIVVWVGAEVCFYINGVCFIVSAISLAFIRRKHRVECPEPTLFQNKPGKVWHEFRVGLKELWHNPDVLYLVKLISVIMFSGGATFVVFPVFVHEHFGVMTHGLSILITALGGGLFIGAIILGRMKGLSNNRMLLSWSMALVIVFFGFLVMIKSFYLAVLLMFFIGFIGVPIAICTETMIHEFVEQHKIGRIYSAMEVVIHAVFLVSMTIAGYLGKFVESGAVLMINTVLTGVLFLAMFPLHREVS